MSTGRESADRPFPEELLSGYLDGVLTQQEEQLVRVQLESDVELRRLLEELKTMREASMSTTFEAPEDRQWEEAARTPVSRVSRGLGLTMLLVWVVGSTGFGLWQMALESESWLEVTLVFGGVAGALLLLVSVAIDRMRDSRSDRYKEVQK
jgi:anti-sigma factor RsiW